MIIHKKYEIFFAGVHYKTFLWCNLKFEVLDTGKYFHPSLSFVSPSGAIHELVMVPSKASLEYNTLEPRGAL
jgi:hypothetical protein